MPPVDTYENNVTAEPSEYLADLGIKLADPVPADFEIDWSALSGDPLPEGTTLPAPSSAVVILPALPPEHTAESFSDLKINRAALAVVNAEQEILSDVGLQTDRKDLFFDQGQAFLAIGHENAKAERARLDALPSFEDAISAFQATIASENRRDRIVDLVEYRLDSEGCLQRRDLLDKAPGALLTDTSWRQLTATQYGVGSPNVNAGLSKRRTMVRRMRARDVAPGE